MERQGAAPGEVVGALADIYTPAGDSGRRETRQLRKTKTTGSANLVSSWVLGMRPLLPRGGKPDSRQAAFNCVIGVCRVLGKGPNDGS